MRFIREIKEKEKIAGYVAVQFDFIQEQREWHIIIYEYNLIQKQKMQRENRVPWMPGEDVFLPIR